MNLSGYVELLGTDAPSFLPLFFDASFCVTKKSMPGRREGNFANGDFALHSGSGWH